MKKMTKKIISAIFGFAFAFTVGAGVYSVCNDQLVVKADEAAITISDAVLSSEVYKVEMSCETWTITNASGDTFDINYMSEDRVECRRNILINGVSLFEINTSVDDSAYVYVSSPLTLPNKQLYNAANKEYDVFQNPTLLAAPVNGNTLTVWIHQDYVNSICDEEGETLTVTMKTGFNYNGATVAEETSKVVYTKPAEVAPVEKTVIETSVTGIAGSYGAEDKHLDFFLSVHDYDTDLNIKAVDKVLLASLDYYDYILIDGEKLGDLVVAEGYAQGEVYFNAWFKESFGTRWPEAMFKAGTIDAVQEVTVLAGCQFPSYNDPNTVYQTTEDVTFTRQESGAFADLNSLMYAEDLDISWAVACGDAGELFRVNISSDLWELKPTQPEGLPQPDIFDFNYYDSGMRDTIKKSILINGKSLYDINTTVDDTDYVYSTYPMTLDNKSGEYDAFANPTMLEVQGNTLILYIHKNYMQSICSNFGDSVTLTVAAAISGSDAVMGKILAEDVVAEVYAIGYDLTLMDGNTELDVLSIKAGNSLDIVPAPTKDHLTFAGWVDAEGNPAPATMPAEVLTLYATWKPVPYTVKVVYLDGSETEFVFGMMKDETLGVEYLPEELEAALIAALPEETETEGYGYAEKIPGTFQLKNYVFTVQAVKNIFTITFVDENGNDIGVAPITFTAKTINDLVLPEVPAKEGYTGKWNKTTDRLQLEDVTLYAVYTEIKEIPETPDKPQDSTTDSSVDGDSTDTSAPNNSGAASFFAGCTGTVGGIAGGLTALAIAAVALFKKKED